LKSNFQNNIETIESDVNGLHSNYSAMPPKKTLGSLTEDFLTFMMDGDGSEVHIDDIAQALQISRRRLSEVISILCIARLFFHTSQSTIQWASKLIPPDSVSDYEKKLDLAIAALDNELIEISNSELFQQFAWISMEDAVQCVSKDEYMVYYAIVGPSTMSITIDPEGYDESEGHSIRCEIEDPHEGTIEFIRIAKE
jgi:hypothetical protein